VVAGAALGVAVQRTAKIVVARLSAREEELAGAALLLIERDAGERQARGERLREDGFFDTRGALRPDAEELLEAVLRWAAATHEERKLPYLSRLYSAVAHDPNVSAPEGLYLVRVAGELTHRQLIALAVYANREDHARAIAHAHGRYKEGRMETDESIVLELSDLADRRLLGIGRPGNVVRGCPVARRT
jgi:hypothetical protein